VAARIPSEGLIQPVILDRLGDGHDGHVRVEACKRLGWRSLPGIARGEDTHLSLPAHHVSSKEEGADYARQGHSTDQAGLVGVFCQANKEQKANQS
jgi:hypothetical protein